MDQAEKQFVILEHTTTNGVHWDLMLEMEDMLWTWRLNVPPVEINNEPIPADPIHHHPKRFLSYEGAVQNNTGKVVIADKGLFSVSKKSDNTLTLELQGRILRGHFTLSKTENSLWELKFDAPAQSWPL